MPDEAIEARIDEATGKLREELGGRIDELEESNRYLLRLIAEQRMVIIENRLHASITRIMATADDPAGVPALEGLVRQIRRIGQSHRPAIRGSANAWAAYQGWLAELRGELSEQPGLDQLLSDEDKLPPPPRPPTA